MSRTIQIPGITQPQLLTAPIYNGSHFTWGEATRDGERMPQQTNFEGVIIPAAQITSNIIKITKELDKIRSQFGDRPITVTSWLRPPAINRDVGGARSSQHLLGWAVDIQIEGLKPTYVASQLRSSWAGGLGNSRIFTHLDLRHLMGWAGVEWNYGNA